MKAVCRERSKNIECHHFVLSDRDSELQMIHSPGAHNYGDWSFYQRGAAGSEEKVSVRVRKSGDFVKELLLDRIDVNKIDTEGAEKEILHGLTPAQMNTVQYIVGEFHSERDFGPFDGLEQRGFDVECKRSFNKPCFISYLHGITAPQVLKQSIVKAGHRS